MLVFMQNLYHLYSLYFSSNHSNLKHRSYRRRQRPTECLGPRLVSHRRRWCSRSEARSGYRSSSNSSASPLLSLPATMPGCPRRRSQQRKRRNSELWRHNRGKHPDRLAARAPHRCSSRPPRRLRSVRPPRHSALPTSRHRSPRVRPARRPAFLNSRPRFPLRALRTPPWHDRRPSPASLCRVCR